MEFCQLSFGIFRTWCDKFCLEDARLIQFFASFSSAMLFVETQRRRIRSIVENLSATQTNTDEEI